jgi:hypothetical protein
MYCCCKNKWNANSLRKAGKYALEELNEKLIILVDPSLCIKFAVVIGYDEFHSNIPIRHCCIPG